MLGLDFKNFLSFKEIKVLIFFLLILGLNFVLRKFLNLVFKNKISDSNKKINNFIKFFIKLKSFLLWGIFILIVLSIYNVNLKNVLTGIGILGIVVALATQALIVDVLSGIFLFLEGVFKIGDKIKIGDIEGEVIDMTLRKTYVKDDKGYIHIIPNSQIKIVSKKNNL